MQLSSEIVYPVFVLPSEFEVVRVGTRVYISTKYSMTQLDDTSKEGSFATRRIKLKYEISSKKANGFEYVPLTRVVGALYTEEQLIAYLPKRRNFVDSTGRIFKHAPTTFYKLTYHKVIRAAIVEGSHTIVWLEGINVPFKLPRAIGYGKLYAGVLRLPNRDILFELTRVKKKDTRRKL